MTQCPVCGASHFQQVIEEASIPVLINQQYTDANESLAAGRGRLNLVVCEQCGHFYNKDFDPALLDYSAAYENALHHSGVFRRYQEELSEEIAGTLSIRNTRILEIGAGQGDFLTLLLQKGAAQAVGYDPSFRGAALDDRLVIHPELFKGNAQNRFDIAVARHVLEHLERPSDVLAEIAKSLNVGGRIYLEVPNALFTIEQMGIWDLIYEHKSYFSQTSLKALINKTGFIKLGLQLRYDNQFISVFGQLADHKPTDPSQNMEIQEIILTARKFRPAYLEKKSKWASNFDLWDQQGKRVLIWGAGSKGCTFANLFRHHQSINGLVDINPLKFGKFAAGTAFQIYSPETIKELRPDILIVMNQIYKDEITQIIKGQSLTTRIEAAE